MVGKGDSTDLYMKFVPYGSRSIEAESSTEFDPASQAGDDPLAVGFQKGSMFEVDKFSFAVGIEDQDAAAAKRKGSGDHAKPAREGHAGRRDAGRSTGSFHAWRAGGKKPYPADIQPASFTRQIDKASSALLQSCIHTKVFSSATLIKRRAAGGVTAGLTYLRIDFYDVLIVDMDWSDDDEVTETCKFVSRKVQVRYVPQLPDGTLGAPIYGFWSVNPDDPVPDLS